MTVHKNVIIAMLCERYIQEFGKQVMHVYKMYQVEFIEDPVTCEKRKHFSAMSIRPYGGRSIQDAVFKTMREALDFVELSLDVREQKIVNGGYEITDTFGRVFLITQLSAPQE